MIIFSVVGLGMTTTPLLMLLNKIFPQDKIFFEPIEPLAGDGEELGDD